MGCWILGYSERPAEEPTVEEPERLPAAGFTKYKSGFTVRSRRVPYTDYFVFAAGQRQAGAWLGAGETKYRGHFGSRYMLSLDKKATLTPLPV